MSDVYILGGLQSDFSINWLKKDTSLEEQLCKAVTQGYDQLKLPLIDTDAYVVGNFAGELFVQQGLMNGLVAQAIPEFYGKPSMRTEAACASGSMAILHAMAQIQAGWANTVCVIGVEQMRNVPSTDTANFLGTAIHQGHECTAVAYPWPHLFGKLGEVYAERYGLDEKYLTYLSQLAFRNAANNPLAQTRSWDMPEEKFSRSHDTNPQVDGLIRRSDCAQVTDGVSMLMLASEEAAVRYSQRNSDAKVSRISGFANTTAPINSQTKQNYSDDYVFPHIRNAVNTAYQRARVTDVSQIDLWETHDCFSTTFYMAIDHLGLTRPGDNWQRIDSGDVEVTGKTPVNPSGGLIGVGHPVGATGVRQMLDCHKQVQGMAQSYQVQNATRACMLNLGGSATTAACFVVESDQHR